MEMQTNDLELGGVEWALSGAGRPIGVAAPEVAPFALLFLLVESVLCRMFVTCTPPTLVSVPVQNLKTKYGTKKGNSAGLKSGESKLYYIEMKRALIT